MKDKKIMITGGAGFIGSHLADNLKENNNVFIYDNFSNPKSELRKFDSQIYFNRDILNLDFLKEKTKNIDVIFHYSAEPSVQKSSKKPLSTFNQNTKATLNVLESARANDVSQIIFASSSTVYGNAETPTPESAPIDPISNYGASKAAAEAFLKSYSSTYGIKYIILRYANIFGPRSYHGVMYDFFKKLKNNPETLEILGDGQQEKSYLYIDDCVNATLKSLETKKSEIYNVGSETKITVNKIAEIITDEMNLNPKLKHTGGRKGWTGDVTKMLLDIKKIKSLGWKPEIPTEKGIRKYIQWLEKHYAQLS